MCRVTLVRNFGRICGHEGLDTYCPLIQVRDFSGIWGQEKLDKVSPPIGVHNSLDFRDTEGATQCVASRWCSILEGSGVTKVCSLIQVHDFS